MHATARNDIHSTYTVPKETLDYLKKLAGTNPYGEPILRLCVAEDRYMKAGGTFTDWDKGSSLQDRGGYDHPEHIGGGVVELTRSRLQPLRTVTEVREVKKYPGVEGWILERWYPASMYGDEEAWMAHKVNGVPALGPYPAQGDYEMIAGPTTRTPSHTALQMAWSRHLQLIEARLNQAATFEARLKIRLNAIEWQDRKEEERIKAENKAILKDYSKPFWGSSLGSGRLRTSIERKLRERGVNIGHAGN